MRETKRLFGMLAVALCIASEGTAQSTPFVPQVQATKLADGVYQMAAGADGYVGSMNMLVIVNDEDVLIFDTSTRPATARAVIAEIRKITDKPVRYVVNSHWHPDHWWGNQVYADSFPQAEFIATEQASMYMRNMGAFFPELYRTRLAKNEAAYASEIATGKDDEGKTLTPKQLEDETAYMVRYRGLAADMQATRPVYPTMTYVDEFRIGRGARQIVLMSITGDAEGTTALYLPAEKILATGDAVGYPTPYFTPPPSRQAASVRRLSQLDVDMIVPGHGPVMRDKDYMRLQAEFFEAVIQRVRVSLRKGMLTVADVQKDVSMEDFRARFTKGDSALNARFDGLAAGVIRIAYLESRDSQEYKN